MKVYARYNGEPYKLYDVYKYHSNGRIDTSVKVDAIWSCFIQYTPDVDVACSMPIIKGKSDTTFIRYLKSEGLHFKDKGWVERHVGLLVQEHIV